MATVMVCEGVRGLARQALQDARVPITREGYTDSSTTTWGFVVRTRKTPRELQRIVHGVGIGWCSATADNPTDIGQEW